MELIHKSMPRHKLVLNLIIQFMQSCCEGIEPGQTVFYLGKNNSNPLQATEWERCEYASELVKEFFNSWDDALDHLLVNIGKILNQDLYLEGTVNEVKFDYGSGNTQISKYPEIFIREFEGEWIRIDTTSKLVVDGQNYEMDFDPVTPKIYSNYHKKVKHFRQNAVPVQSVIAFLQSKYKNGNIREAYRYTLFLEIQGGIIDSQFVIPPNHPTAVENFVRGWIYYGLPGYQSLMDILAEKKTIQSVEFDLDKQFSNLVVNFYPFYESVENLSVALRPEILSSIFVPDVKLFPDK